MMVPSEFPSTVVPHEGNHTTAAAVHWLFGPSPDPRVLLETGWIAHTTARHTFTKPSHVFELHLLHRFDFFGLVLLLLPVASLDIFVMTPERVAEGRGFKHPLAHVLEGQIIRNLDSTSRTYM
mmetsp:Transcript_8790/g.19161  ORF Transcript_8790/g.19161 Transcript_8790/m.19161 type:complete len:123 (-) Transcript_8790:132-500(-)